MDRPSGGASAGVGSTGSGAFAMLRNMSMKAGAAIRDGAARTSEAVREGTKNVNIQKFGTQAGETFNALGKSAAEGATYAYNMGRSTATKVYGRLQGQPLMTECQRESREAPCPRIVLLCCTALCSGGLASEGLFTSASEGEHSKHLFEELAAAYGAKLLPAGATPQLVADVLKNWLCSLPEPLLTFKLVPALTSPDLAPDQLRVVLSELPVVNANAMFMILDTCHRIASNAAINDTDAQALATVLAPCLLWREGDPAAAAAHDPNSPTARAAGEPLSADDQQVFVKLLSYMISNFRTLL